MINIQGISKSFGEFQVFNNLDAEISLGSSVALIGPSGCGKSTLIRLIIGLLKPDSGSIEIDGITVTDQSLASIRHKTGYVIQQGGLFPHLTARENCSLAAEYHGWDKNRVEQRLMNLCELTGISYSQLDKYPHEFSGGQNQRISLIRALMLDPEILLLDEPLASIDPLVRFELQEDLKEIFKSLNKTVIFVTHDLGEAGYLADEIFLMNEGKIEQKGAIEEIIKHPKNEFVQRFVYAHRNHLESV